MPLNLDRLVRPRQEEEPTIKMMSNKKFPFSLPGRLEARYAKEMRYYGCDKETVAVLSSVREILRADRDTANADILDPRSEGLHIRSKLLEAKVVAQRLDLWNRASMTVSNFLGCYEGCIKIFTNFHCIPGLDEHEKALNRRFWALNRDIWALLDVIQRFVANPSAQDHSQPSNIGLYFVLSLIMSYVISSILPFEINIVEANYLERISAFAQVLEV